jgi:hypothetical protein
MNRMRVLMMAAFCLAGCAGAPVGGLMHDDPVGAREVGQLDVETPAAVAPPEEMPSPPATATPPVKAVLDVVWQGQQTSYWCGPGSTRMALSTRLATPPSQQTLATLMGTTVNGTDHIGLVRDALNMYLATQRYESKTMYDPPTQAQRDGLAQDLVRNVSEGFPLVANVISGWRPPGYPGGTIYHYVAVVGYDQGGERVLIADPASDGAAGASWTNVPRTYWISLWDLGTWIGGKGYAG